MMQFIDNKKKEN